MKVIVYDNQIEKAIRDLKRKLSKEGFFFGDKGKKVLRQAKCAEEEEAG